VRPRAKVTIDSLYKVVNEKSISTKMNDLELCLKVVQGHVNHCGVNSLLLELETSNLVHGFVWRMASRRSNNFPKSRRGLVSRSVQW